MKIEQIIEFAKSKWNKYGCWNSGVDVDKVWDEIVEMAKDLELPIFYKLYNSYCAVTNKKIISVSIDCTYEATINNTEDAITEIISDATCVGHFEIITKEEFKQGITEDMQNKLEESLNKLGKIKEELEM